MSTQASARIASTCAVLVLFLPFARSQEPTPGSVEDLAGTEQTVEVESTTSDKAIERRLQGIFEAAGDVEPVSVRVKRGLVFLTGRVASDRDREWATQVVSRTEGVVAVRNDLEVLPGPIWDPAPALHELRSLWQQFVQSIPLILIGLVVMLVTLAISRAVTPVLSRLLMRRSSNRILEAAVGRAVGLAFTLFGLYIFLRIAGLTRVAATIVGGTGLIGLVLGLAFRDIGENLLASLLISIQRPFRIGDTVEIEGSTGVVEQVTLRGTLLMDFDGNHVQIPNSVVYKSTIRNYTANPNRRIDFSVGIGFDASILKAQKLSLEVLQEHSAVLSDPRPKVLVERLGAATVDLRLYSWIDGSKHDPHAVRSALMRLVVGTLSRAGISLPDEAREVVFPESVPVRMLQAEEEPSPAPDTEGSEELEAAEGEGDLGTEVHDLKEQSRRSRSPEDGAIVLEE